MTAVICRHFGLKHLEVAEDLVSDTFLKATELWGIHGLPEHPKAWLYAVAKNKAIDHFRRLAAFGATVTEAGRDAGIAYETEFEIEEKIIADSQLAMIFAVCTGSHPIEGQICLALQVLCGFSVEEIANSFLAKPETVKKRLHRARTSLRREGFKLRTLSEADVKAGLNTVLKTIYLLFNEGYFSKTGKQLVRKELCAEALRLALVLTENPLTNTPATNALIALLCFQSSRLEARTGPGGETMRFDEQDRSLWDEALITEGHYYLVNSCTGNEVSKYHLEAGIAYWHAKGSDESRWQHILQLYNQLILIEYSPVTALNRLFAYARVYGAAKALAEAETLNLEHMSAYHALKGYLYTDSDAERAVAAYGRALDLTRSKHEKQILLKEIERLKDRKSSAGQAAL